MTNNENLTPEQFDEKRKKELEESVKLAEERQKAQLKKDAENKKTVTVGGTKLTKKQLEERKAKNKEAGLDTDNKGRPNVSRGIVGLKSAAGYITKGTVADHVNPPNNEIFDGKGNRNPVTEADLQRRIANERAAAGMDKEYQEQVTIKARIEMQNEKYTPPKKYADSKKYPELAPTPDFTQVSKTTAKRGSEKEISTQ